VKKILKNNKRTKQYLDKLPKMYIVGYWAKVGVADFPFSGKYEEHNGISIPLVYQFDDNNGEYAAYYLRRIDHTTSGAVFFWTQFEHIAKRFAEWSNKNTENLLKK
jgi:hypothetical protein